MRVRTLATRLLAGATLLGGAAGAASACDAFGEASGVVPPDGGGAEDAPLPPGCDAAVLDRDPKNCGLCGHDCLGGACTGGTCAPFVMTTRLGEAEHLVLTTSRLVWRQGNTLLTCPKEGCPPVGATSIVAPGTRDVAARGDDVYLARANHVAHLSSSNQINQIAMGYASTERLVVDDNDVYFVNVGPADGGPDEAGVVTVSREGGTPRNLAPDIYDFEHLAVSPSTLYGADDFEIRACKLPGCGGRFDAFAGADAGAQVLGRVLGLVATEDDVYWTTRDNPGVFRCAAKSNACIGVRGASILGPTTFGMGGERPRDLALDGDRLLVTINDGTIGSCDPAACTATWKVIAKEPRDVAGGAVADGQAYYWIGIEAAATDAGPGSYRLMKLAK